MKNTADFLDALRVKLDLPSDNALGKHLGIHRQHISHYRNLRVTFDDETSIRIAEILEVKPAYVMACMHYQRAKNPKVRDAWEYLGGLAAVLAIVSILPFVPGIGPDNLSAPALLGAAMQPGSLYIMSNFLAAYWWLFLPLAALALCAFPLHNPRPEKEPDNLSNKPARQ